MRTGTAGEWAILSFLLVVTVVASLLSVGAFDDEIHTKVQNSIGESRTRTLTVDIQVDADRDVNVTAHHINGSECVLVDYLDD